MHRMQSACDVQDGGHHAQGLRGHLDGAVPRQARRVHRHAVPDRDPNDTHLRASASQCALSCTSQMMCLCGNMPTSCKSVGVLPQSPPPPPPPSPCSKVLKHLLCCDACCCCCHRNRDNSYGCCSCLNWARSSVPSLSAALRHLAKVQV